MKLSRFIELLQEEDIDKDLEVSCGISIDPTNKKISFPETKWNKLTTRELTIEEKEEHGNLFDSVWEGISPEIDEDVLVCLNGKDVEVDRWVEYGGSVGLESLHVDDVVYWMSMPEPPRGV